MNFLLIDNNSLWNFSQETRESTFLCRSFRLFHSSNRFHWGLLILVIGRTMNISREVSRFGDYKTSRRSKVLQKTYKSHVVTYSISRRLKNVEYKTNHLTCFIIRTYSTLLRTILLLLIFPFPSIFPIFFPTPDRRSVPLFFSVRILLL